ncbi:hypothetical protein CHLNCDRAFT_52636 [Chlorella variabilis]|uniref:CBM20 domain-containing protein n=1 Tax=Chlorella variabilis TaxID=554065 RepID=E1ZG60_CHLVA|nr:hypothetical protein CHLNCDRAFT_52636 [Chlorella variabilis]EFN55410.1 hypothetical protein CHLNCDRAFT_52636 [Chlorella variabilis]|eukprot:XP_005847512.1 hypothetical protein CHLNCDRAFT_52636 [Chlorella variabilis]
MQTFATATARLVCQAQQQPRARSSNRKQRSHAAGNSRPVKQRSKRREQGRGAAGATLLAEREVAITAAPAADRQPSPSSAKLPAVIPDVLEFPPHEEEAAAASPAAATTSAASPAAATAAAAAAVRVAVTVPGCHLQFGEHLRVVGNCPELGEWDAQAAPALIWHEDDVWKGELTLPSGRHVAFKLVIVRGDGVTLYWEPGADRRLRVPRLDAAAAADDAGLLVTCRFADTRGTVVECPQLQEAARAAAARVAALQEERQQLKSAVVACWQEVQDSEERLGLLRREVEEAVILELAVQQQERQQQAEREAAAAATATAADPGEPGIALAVLAASLHSVRERLSTLLLPSGADHLQQHLRRMAGPPAAPRSVAMAAEGGGGSGGKSAASPPPPGMARSSSMDHLPQLATFGSAAISSHRTAPIAHALPEGQARRLPGGGGCRVMPTGWPGPPTSQRRHTTTSRTLQTHLPRIRPSGDHPSSWGRSCWLMIHNDCQVAQPCLSFQTPSRGPRSPALFLFLPSVPLCRFVLFLAAAMPANVLSP